MVVIPQLLLLHFDPQTPSAKITYLLTQPSMFPSNHYPPIILPTNLPTHLLSYLPTYLFIYLVTYLPSNLPIYLPSYLPTFQPIYKT
jgi:hypothetical protein